MALRQSDLLLAQRLAVCRARILFVRRTIGDVTVDNYQCWSIRRAFECPECAIEHLQVIGVPNARDIPAESDEARGHIIAIGERRVTLDRYVVVVVDPAEIIELEMSRQRGGLSGNSFHHAAVAAQGVYVIIEQLESGTIEVAGQPALGDRHANASRQALPKRARCRFDARGPTVFRMAGAFAVKLSEALDILQRHRQLS